MKKFIENTIWFWKESHKFVKPWTLKDILLAPKAYYIFMLGMKKGK
jgi:hypothetical protein